MTVDLDPLISPALVRVVSRWDERAFETTGITPSNASSAVILWEGFPDVEGGVPDRVARPLASALTARGEVCFRAADRSFQNMRVLGTLKTSHGPFARSRTIVGTRDIDAAMTLFDTGWAQGDQIAIIAPVGDERAKLILASKDLGGISLKGAELVAGAVVDGAGMLIATPDRAALKDAIDLILRRCADAGISHTLG